MKLKQIAAVFTLAAVISSFSACSSENLTIPTVNEGVTLSDLASKLDVSDEEFNKYLESLNMSYDEFITNMNNNNQDIDAMKKGIEEAYNCKYSEYIRTVILVSNTEEPDANKYTPMISKYGIYNTYVPTAELSADKTKLKNYDVAINIADEDEDAYAFDVINNCSGDLSLYMTALNDAYQCTSAEITNITVLGNYGVKKPKEDNSLLNSMFVFNKNTDDVLEQISIPVITLHFDKDESRNKTLALCNEMGLIFKTEGADSLDKMLDIINIDFQVRYSSLMENAKAVYADTENTQTETEASQS